MNAGPEKKKKRSLLDGIKLAYRREERRTKVHSDRERAQFDARSGTIIEYLDQAIVDGDALAEDIRVVARRAAPIALSALAKICLDTKESATSRVNAASLILDRAYGKPAQPLVGDGGEGPVDMRLDVRFVAAATLETVESTSTAKKVAAGASVIDAVSLMNSVTDNG